VLARKVPEGLPSVLLPGLLPGEPRKNMSGEPRKALQRLDGEFGVAVGDATVPTPTTPSEVTLLAFEFPGEGCFILIAILDDVSTALDGEEEYVIGLLGLRNGVTGKDETDDSISSLELLMSF